MSKVRDFKEGGVGIDERKEMEVSSICSLIYFLCVRRYYTLVYHILQLSALLQSPLTPLTTSLPFPTTHLLHPEIHVIFCSYSGCISHCRPTAPPLYKMREERWYGESRSCGYFVAGHGELVWGTRLHEEFCLYVRCFEYIFLSIFEYLVVHGHTLLRVKPQTRR